LARISSTNFLLSVRGEIKKKKILELRLVRLCCELAMILLRALGRCAPRSVLAPRRWASSGPGGGQIGFIGLGNMGAAMAANMLKAHGSAIVYDVRAGVCARLVRALCCPPWTRPDTARPACHPPRTRR